MMQLFNLINARKINDELNVFSGFYKNYMFCGVFIFIAAGQVIII